MLARHRKVEHERERAPPVGDRHDARAAACRLRRAAATRAEGQPALPEDGGVGGDASPYHRELSQAPPRPLARGVARGVALAERAARAAAAPPHRRHAAGPRRPRPGGAPPRGQCAALAPQARPWPLLFFRLLTNSGLCLTCVYLRASLARWCGVYVSALFNHTQKDGTLFKKLKRSSLNCICS